MSSDEAPMHFRILRVFAGLSRFWVAPHPRAVSGAFGHSTGMGWSRESRGSSYYVLSCTCIEPSIFILGRVS